MDHPAIYSVVKVPVLGQLGEHSKVMTSRDCPACDAAPRQEIAYLDYAFDFWEREPLVGIAQDLAVTKAMRAGLLGHALSGFTFRGMRAEYGDTYEPMPGDPDLGEFWQLVVEHRIRAGSGWWTRTGECSVCGQTLWELNDWTTRGIVGAHNDGAVPPRRVLRSDYGGWDIFYLDDPGPAIITERMRDVLMEHGATGLELQPAEFVDSVED